MLKVLLLFLRLSGTVDRIEGGWAIVEWTDGSFSDLPLSVFPRAPKEGERFAMRLRPVHDGLGIALSGEPPRISTHAGLMELPSEHKPRPGHRYRVCIRFFGETECRFPVQPSP